MAAKNLGELLREGMRLHEQSQCSLDHIQLERDWDAALIEQSLREAIFLCHTLVYLSDMPKQAKDEVWAFSLKWARVLGIEGEDHG